MVTENDTIALFPQEWARDPKSEFLQSAYHDVPWEESELIRSCVRKGRPAGGLLTQVWPRPLWKIAGSRPWSLHRRVGSSD
jgi:hypothetical protein